MPAILIVCTANICRSPMAEAILKHLVASRQDANQWYIESAGTWAKKGYPAAELSQYVMQTMGMDISSHKSQPVSLELVQRFDLILTMENNQKEGMIVQFGQYANRIFMLSEMIGIMMDIPDPIGGEMIDYEETAHRLEHIMLDGLDRIYQQALLNQNNMRK
jgi:protein-tyrosine-phosphatase